MKISIIMVTYNSEKTVRSSINSIKNQKDIELELVIIDGGSLDQTLNILKEYESIIDILVSEPDNGTYDALNKGIKLCSGDILGILHSDDIFANQKSLSNVSDIFLKYSCSVVFGNIEFFRGNLVKRKWIAGSFKLEELKNGWHPPHTSFFVRRKLVEENEIYYDLSYKIGADLKWMINILYIASDVIYLNKTLIYMRIGGASTTLKGHLTSVKETYRTYKDLGFSIFRVTYIFYKRYVFKLKQLFIKTKTKLITD